MHTGNKNWKKKTQKANSLLPGAPKLTQKKQNKSSKVMDSTKNNSEFPQQLKSSSNWFCTWRKHQNPSTAYGGTASSRAELSLLTRLTNPSPSLCCSHDQNQTRNGHKFALLFPFFPFYHSWLCLHHPMCCP